MRGAAFNRLISVLDGGHGRIPYLISTAMVLGTYGIRLALAPLLGDQAPLLPFIVSGVLSAGLYGVGPGLLSILLSATLATLTFLDPFGPQGLSPEQLTNVVVFLTTGVAMMLFASHLRAARLRSEMLEVELMQAQATAAMGTMAGTLAHELNQPLAAAANYVAACQQLASVPERRPQLLIKGLQQAEAQIQRAGDIIRHARSLIRNAPIEREPSSLHRMFRRVIEVMKASAIGSNVRFSVDIGQDADAVAVNPIQIEQVLVNLLRNACESVSKFPLAEVHLKATATDKGTLVEVRDTGAGIPANRLSTLFSATQSSGKGLGIGLSICRTIVEAHGGGIWAQNNPEGGASFFLLLPGAGDE